MTSASESTTRTETIQKIGSLPRISWLLLKSTWKRILPVKTLGIGRKYVKLKTIRWLLRMKPDGLDI